MVFLGQIAGELWFPTDNTSLADHAAQPGGIGRKLTSTNHGVTYDRTNDQRG